MYLRALPGWVKYNDAFQGSLPRTHSTDGNDLRLGQTQGKANVTCGKHSNRSGYTAMTSPRLLFPRSRYLSQSMSHGQKTLYHPVVWAGCAETPYWRDAYEPVT